MRDPFPSSSRQDRFPGLGEKLVLTYANSTATDGVGAQLQRIYGTYAIARLLGASYLHSPLSRVDYQGLGALEHNRPDPAFHLDFNELLEITSDVSPLDEFRELHLSKISLGTVLRLVERYERNETNGRPWLVRLDAPYGIADRYPDCYEACKEISPFPSSVPGGRALRVAVHVRRGELFLVESDRMLPNSYYICIAQQIVEVLEALALDYHIELHTEVPTKAFFVQPGHHGIYDRIDAPVLLTPEMCRLEEFDVLPHLIPYVNGGAIDCLRRLATADILVMSKSSFSYLGGILNRNVVVLYHPFWHGAPSSWMTVGQDGHCDQLQLTRAVTTLLRRQAGG